MNIAVRLQDGTRLELEDRHFLASGGQAKLYRIGDSVYKLYHRATNTIPSGKLTQLAVIASPRVILPQQLILDPDRHQPIGVTMPFIDHQTPLVKLLAPSFRFRHGIDQSKTIALLGAVDAVLQQVHRANCLVVDLNEMNILLDSDYALPTLIDADSYQTPDHPATAISPSILDPLVVNNRFSQKSDWFAFGVLAFQMFTGIHPYKGRHPQFKPGQWTQRMRRGVSVFDPQVRLPNFVPDLSSIPEPYLAWFRELFVHQGRPAPPTARPFHRVGVPTIVTASANAWLTLPEPIIGVFPGTAGLYLVTRKHLYHHRTPIAELNTADMSYVVENQQGEAVIGQTREGTMLLRCGDREIGRVPADACFVKDRDLFSLNSQHLIRHRFTRLGPHCIRTASIEAYLHGNRLVALNGAVIMWLLEVPHLIMPNPKKGCRIRPLPEMKGWTPLSGQARGDRCLILAKRGVCHRLFNVTGRVTWNDSDYFEPDFVSSPGGGILHNDDQGRLIDRGLPVAQLPEGSVLFGWRNRVWFTDGPHIRCYSPPGPTYDSTGQLATQLRS